MSRWPDGGRFVLGHHIATGRHNRLRAVEAIGAHAGEHDRHVAPHFGGEANSGSTDGLQKLIIGPSSSAITLVPVSRRATFMWRPPGGDIDVSGVDLLAVLGLARRLAGEPRQMLGEDGGEGRRHMLGDEHKRALSITLPTLATMVLSAFGPPVEQPIKSTRGAVSGIGRSTCRYR